MVGDVVPNDLNIPSLGTPSKQMRLPGGIAEGSGEIVGSPSSFLPSPQPRYGPCRRNHSVASGGLTLDGCQEFDTDSNLSKTCSACGCHRSFHSRLTENQKLENIPPLITQVASTALATSTQFLSPSSGILTSLSPDDSWYNFLEPCSISLNGTPVLTFVDSGQFEVKVGALPSALSVYSSREKINPEKQKAEPLHVVNLSRGRKPCRSRQLRTKSCQIWTDYLRPLALSEGINIRFCDNKDVCLAEMQKGGHTSCAARRLQLKWPDRVPFIHPKDFTIKELQSFIDTYEVSWQKLLPHPPHTSGQSPASSAALPRVPKRDADPCKVSTKELRYWLRENGKPIFSVHPKAANQFVNMGKLASMILRKGGKRKFEAAGGWDLFITSSEGMNKPSLSSMERRKCIHTVKALYNKFIMEYIQDILKDMGLESDGSMAAAEISDAEGNEEDDVDDNGHVDATSGANGDGDTGLCTGSTDPSKI